MLTQMLPDLAKKGAADFATMTGTTPLTEIVSAACTGKPNVLAGSPGIMLKDCKLVFKNGTGTTTFTTTVYGSVVLKGQPDPYAPNDPNGQRTLATADKITDVHTNSLLVTDGIAPQLPSPIPLSDSAKIEAHVKAGLVASEIIGANVEDFGPGRLSDCSEVQVPSGPFPTSVKKKCFGWLDDRYEGQTIVAFEVSGDNVIGVRWMGSGGNF